MDKDDLDRYKTQTVTVTIETIRPPTQLTRSVRATKLDLFITIGSIFGLFFGASILSFTEIFYLWMVQRA